MSSACAARFRLGSVKLRGSGRSRRIAPKAGSIKRAAPAVGQSLLHLRAGANPAARNPSPSVHVSPAGAHQADAPGMAAALPLVAPRAGEPSPGAGRSAAGTTASRHPRRWRL